MFHVLLQLQNSNGARVLSGDGVMSIGMNAINTPNVPGGDPHWQLFETISWTYVDRGGTHTQTKTFTTQADRLTPAQQLLNDVKSRLSNTSYSDSDKEALIKAAEVLIKVGYTDPDIITDIIRGEAVPLAAFDDPTIAKMMNALSPAEQRIIVQQVIKNQWNRGYVRSCLNQWNFDRLQHTGNFRPHALDHIFKGEINPQGDATGYHYEGLPSVLGEAVPGSATSPDRVMPPLACR